MLTSLRTCAIASSYPTGALSVYAAGVYPSQRIPCYFATSIKNALILRPERFRYPSLTGLVLQVATRKSKLANLITDINLLLYKLQHFF